MSNGKFLRMLGAAIVAAVVAILLVSYLPARSQQTTSSTTQSKQESEQGSAQSEGESRTQDENESEKAMSTDYTQTQTGDAFSASHNLRHAEISVKDYGTITFELDATVAPESVENFCRLASEGFYNGNSFHRIISGFMIQGGADTTGTQPNITGEFGQNGYDNPISHVRGVISMARASDFNSGSTQFFIVHKDSLFLDGAYAAFGRVTDGMDVVDAIAENTPVQDDNGTVAEADQPIIESARVLD